MVVPTEQWNKLPQVIERVTGVGFSPTDVMQDGTSHKEAHPHMQAALQHLEQVQKELRDALHEEGEHRARALQFTENAIHEVRMAFKRGSAIETNDPFSMRSGFGRRCEVH